jgi:hypothetical protein
MKGQLAKGFWYLVQMQATTSTGFNGMDAPARHGIGCAKVEVSSNHLTGRSVHEKHYDRWSRFDKEHFSGAWRG